MMEKIPSGDGAGVGAGTGEDMKGRKEEIKEKA